MPREDPDHIEELDNGFIRTRKVLKPPADDRLAAIEVRLAAAEAEIVKLKKSKNPA